MYYIFALLLHAGHETEAEAPPRPYSHMLEGLTQNHKAETMLGERSIDSHTSTLPPSPFLSADGSSSNNGTPRHHPTRKRAMSCDSEVAIKRISQALQARPQARRHRSSSASVASCSVPKDWKTKTRAGMREMTEELGTMVRNIQD